MERFQEELARGRRSLQVADHVISVTYPLVGDSRLLLSSVENLFAAAKGLMASLLHYELAFKRIPHFREEYDSMLYWFQLKCVPHYNLSRNYCTVMGELKALVDGHKSSPMEFARKDGMIICSENYSIKKITGSQLKSYVASLRRMLAEVEGVVSGYEGIFGRRTGRIEAR
jgi:hypothetical protein